MAKETVKRRREAEVLSEAERRRTIEVDSQELLFEALKTLPVLPDIYHLYFGLEGKTFYPSEKEKKAYINRCQQKGVIPFSGLELTYNSFTRQFESTAFGFGKIDPDLSIENIGALARGGKIDRLGFRYHLRSDGREGYQLFRNKVFSSLRESEYKVDFCTLNILNDHGSEDTTISLRSESGLGLSFGYDLEDKDFYKLKDWFNQLKAKHTHLPLLDLLEKSNSSEVDHS